MRVSLRRTVLMCYVVLCGFLSLLNYRYAGGYLASNEVQSDSTDSSETEKSTKTTEKPNSTELLPPISNIPVAKSFGLWPDETNSSDRILAQLNFIPDVVDNRTFGIFLPHGLGGWNVRPDSQEFHDCPVSNCELFDRYDRAATAAAVLFRNAVANTNWRRPEGQVWILYALESPENTPSLESFVAQINWTATYRRDSDFVTPYEKFVSYKDIRNYPNLIGKLSGTSTKRNKTNFAKEKTKFAAWFVSNCMTSNRRAQFAQELANHIQLDIYGGCGPFKCPRFNAKCTDLLNNDYKFYLAFENSNCRDYITEKFFVTGLQRDVIPVVMGGKKVDYEAVAPPHSYIHIEDFPTVKSLADYLHLLSGNDTLYNEYFRWKGTGEFVNTKFWCRLCAMLNAERRKVYRDINSWWRDSGTCTQGRWDSLNKPISTGQQATAKQKLNVKG